MLADWYTTRTYGNNSWGDLLTQVGTNAITYDEIGNMTQHGAWKYEWEHGRELQKMIYNVGNDNNTANDIKWEVVYNADGLRTQRAKGDLTYQYVYNGSSLSQMSIVTGTGDSATTTTMVFAYDASGSPMSVTYGDATYYYVTNLQGDVVALLDSNGNTVVQYTYDAWGRLLSNEPTANSIGNLNPLRYRGYVFDSETSLYYLQSRYYDPQLGRFINPDEYPATGQGLLGNNMFTYCGNSPVVQKDSSGNAIETVFDIISLGASIAEVAVNPADPWAWVGLIGDLADVAIPCVGGLGEAVRALKAADAIDETLDIAKITQNTLKKISAVANAISLGGENFVYTADMVNQSGVLEYVGITNDFDRRKHEWKGIRDIDKYLDNLDRDTARFTEQAVITLIGKGGNNTLSNIRNSIGAKGKLIDGFKTFMNILFD